MTSRILPREDWHRLRPIYGTRPLPVDGSTVVVAEDGDRIVGMLVLQWVPHLEPLWIHEDYRGKAWWPSLVDTAVSRLQGGEYYAFAPTPRIAAMCDAVGLVQLPWTVFRGET